MPQFQPGQSGNPKGRPHSLFVSFADRLAHWLETKTASEIAALVRNKAEWGKLSAIDAVVVRRIAAAMAKDKSTQDFVAVLDRLIGKPVQPIAATFDHRHGLADRIEEAMKKLNAEKSIAVTIDQVKEKDQA